MVKGLQPVHPSILKTFFPAVAAAIWRLFSSISAFVTPHSSTLYIADAYLSSNFSDLRTQKVFGMLGILVHDLLQHIRLEL